MWKLSLAAAAGLLLLGGAENPNETYTYQVRHDHRFGGCEGRLIISDNRIAFESLSKADHSREFTLSGIKEIDRDNPYEVKLKPFVGNEYEFDLIGHGMSNAEYQELMKRVGSARAFGDHGSNGPAGDQERSRSDRLVLRARHEHLRGGCEGTLIITDDGITYESLSKASHSRQLQLGDIKELERDNPYELTVKPFLGGDYDFRLTGTGLGREEFQQIVDRIASTRAAR